MCAVAAESARYTDSRRLPTVRGKKLSPISKRERRFCLRNPNSASECDHKCKRGERRPRIIEFLEFNEEGREKDLRGAAEKETYWTAVANAD